VFELKEELHRANVHLETLKKQWAAHEAVKKRNGFRHSEQLQALTTPLASSATLREDETKRGIRELDRRNLVSTSARTTHRKVLEGRHTRTLSLLSPKESTGQHASILRDYEATAATPARSRNAQIPPTVDEIGASETLTPTELYKSPDKDAILETGKQLVGDFRQGLLTFFEDLKQVTVGEEVTDPRVPLHQNISRRAPIRSRRNTMVETPIMESNTGNGVRDSQKQEISHPAKINTTTTSSAKEARNTDDRRPADNGLCAEQANAETSDSDDGGWDSWDLPDGKHPAARKGKKAQIVDAMASPLTDKSTPRTSMR